MNKTLSSHDGRLISQSDRLDTHLEHLESLDVNVADIRYEFSPIKIARLLVGMNKLWMFSFPNPRSTYATKRELGGQTSRIDTLFDEVDSTNSDLAKRASELQTSIDGNAGDIGVLRSDMTDAQSNITDLGSMLHCSGPSGHLVGIGIGCPKALSALLLCIS